MLVNELVRRIKEDGEAFDKIIKFYYPRAINYVARYFKDSELAQDAVQEFFGIKIYKAKLQNYIESPIDWICTSCKNIALDILKEKCDNQIKIEVSNFDDEALAVEFENISSERAILEQNSANAEVLATRDKADDYFAVLLAADIPEKMIKKFKLMDRVSVEIYIMFFWEGFTLKEIAAKFEMNYDTIKSKFRRGKKVLKSIFSKLHLFAYFFQSNV